LRKFNKDCCIVVICHIDNKNVILENYLNENNTNIIYGNFDHNKLITTERFYLIEKFLTKYQNFKKILVSDMNDAMFQADPFIINFENKIYCSCEASNISDNDFCGNINRRWITEYYKKYDNKINVLEKYNNKKILCAGTILGYRIQILDFLIFLRISNLKINLNDQGLYNIYCYNNPDKCIIIEYGNGLILTCGAINNNSVKKSKSNELLNNKNETYIILHQMDK
jgi:hypothetical protein